MGVDTYRKTADVAFEHSLQIELRDLAFKATREARVHGGATAEYDVLVELGSHVHVGSLDRVEHELGDAEAFAVGQMRLEQDLWRLEALATKFNDTAVRQLVEAKKEAN